MSGYHDYDLMQLDCGTWDTLTARVTTIEEKFELGDSRIETLEQARVEYLNSVPAKVKVLTEMAERLVSLEDMFKQMCDALRKCGVEGMPNRSLCYTCKLNQSCSKSTLREGVSTRVTGCDEYISTKKEKSK